MKIKDMEDSELISLIECAYDAVDNDCFGSRDIMTLIHGSIELENRGYLVDSSSKLIISKE